jgi:two-component system response regulator HydG
MGLTTQSKNLRVLQEGEFERLGGSETIKVDVRLVAATHKDLDAMIKQETFRQDLYYRLAVVPIELPPLRERQGDIAELAHHFLARYTTKNKKIIKGFHPETLSVFMRYNWPGNIREREMIRAILLETNNNKSLAAKHLGIARQTLINKLKEYEL